jgi:hypothetical protein
MISRVVYAYILILLFLVSCAPSKNIYYSPNRFYQQPASVSFSDGHTVPGLLTLNNEVMIRKVQFKPVQESKQQSLHLLEIASYKIGNDTYELKHRMNSRAFDKSDYFMKRLTPANSKIHLYEFLERSEDRKSGKPISYQPHYFIELPELHRNAVWSLSSHHLTPFFDKKMAEWIKDCAVLQQKISSKKEGYYYRHTHTTEKERAAVVLRIINEYNSCR